MKPLKLIIDGFLSYGTRQEIDFSRLLNTGIFIIHGETGAGKSSIIDAISFAIYGRIPRFHKETRKDIFINYNRKKCLVDYEFEIRDTRGKRKTYRIIRTASSYGTSEVEIREKALGAPEKRYRLGVREATNFIAENILALPYDLFIRTIVLPQGKFSEFLLSTASQKSEIILKLSGIEDLYSFVKESVSKSVREATLVLQNYNQRLEELKDLSEKDVDENQKRIQKIEEEIKARTRELEKLEKEIDQINHELAEYDSIISKINQLEQMSGEKERVENIIRDKRNEKLRCEREIKITSLRSEALREFYKIAEESKLENLSRELLAVSLDEFRIKLENIARVRREITKKMETKGRKSDEFSKLKMKLERVTAERASLPPLEFLRTIKERFQRLVDISKEKKTIRQRISELEKDRLDKRSKMGELEKREKEKSDEFERIERGKEELERRIEEERLKMLSSEVRASLKDGDICPVCGNVFRTSNIFDEDRQELELLTKNLREKQEELKRRSDAIKRELGRIQGAKETISRELINLERHIQVKNEEVRKIEEAESDLCGSIVENIKKANLEDELRYIIDSIDLDPFENVWFLKSDGSGVLEKITKLEDRIQDYEKEISQVQAEIKNLARTIEELEEEIEDMHRMITRAFEDVSILSGNVERFKDISENIARATDELIKYLGSSQRSVGEELEKSDDLDVSTEIISELSGISATTKKIVDIASSGGEIRDLRNDEFIDESLRILKLLNDLKSSVTSKISEFFRKVERAMTRFNEALKEKESNLNAIVSELISYESKLKVLDESIKAMQYELLEVSRRCRLEFSDLESLGAKVRQMREDRLSLKKDRIEMKNSVLANIRYLSERKGRLERETEELLKKLEEKRDIQMKKDELIRTLNVLVHIDGDFSSSGKTSFKNYLMWSYMKKIVDYGSSILKEISGGRYSFTILQDGNVRIIDSYYNQREREPESLSGGELFISSLSLALSLATSMLGRSKFECFFIDEGFGSLDRESLEIVVNSLEKLAGRGLNLGIISHVEDMKKIPSFAKLKVTRDKQSGYSTVQLLEAD